MVRVKSGANNSELDETQKLFWDLNKRMLALRSLQIAEIERAKAAMKAISEEMTNVCNRIDEYWKQYAERTHSNRRRNGQPDRHSVARRSISTMLALRTEATPASMLIANPVQQRKSIESTSTTRKASKPKPPPKKATQAIVPASSRVLRNRAEILRKAEHSRSMRQLVRFDQEEVSERRSIRQMTSYLSSTRTSYRQEIMAICTPCTIPLRNCDRRLQKRK